MPFAYLLSTSETKNNAHANQEFVAPNIIELLENAKAVPCKHKPYIVNPLTVIENKNNYRGYDWQNCQSQDQTYNQRR